MDASPAVPTDSVSVPETMISVRNLTKVFDGGFVAVDDISFDVKRGEIFGLLGPNGAGKSTTLRILSTLERPTSGTATIGGYDVVKDDTQARRLIGLVSEKMIMYDRLTAGENLEFFGSLFDIPRDALKKRIDELLELVQLTRWKDSQVGTFSTGMRQRLNVIRALLNNPQVLYLDEPTLGLDPQSAVEIREFVRKTNQESHTTVIITTHILTDADLMCERIAIVDHGKLIALDTPSNLKRTISADGTTVIEMNVPNLSSDLLGNVRGLDSVESVSEESPTAIRIQVRGDDAFDSVIDAVRKNGGRISSMESIEPTLEDVFLHLTGHDVRDSADEKMPLAPRRRFGAGQQRAR